MYYIIMYIENIFINSIYLISKCYRKWLQKKERKNFPPFGNLSCSFFFFRKLCM